MQAVKPVVPITEIAPVAGLMDSRLPSKDIVKSDPFGLATKYWMVGGIELIEEKEPVATSI